MPGPSLVSTRQSIGRNSILSSDPQKKLTLSQRRGVRTCARSLQLGIILSGSLLWFQRRIGFSVAFLVSLCVGDAKLQLSRNVQIEDRISLAWIICHIQRRRLPMYQKFIGNNKHWHSGTSRWRAEQEIGVPILWQDYTRQTSTR